MLFNLETLDNFGNFFKYCVGKTWGDRHISSQGIFRYLSYGHLIAGQEKKFRIVFFLGHKNDFLFLIKVSCGQGKGGGNNHDKEQNT